MNNLSLKNSVINLTRWVAFCMVLFLVVFSSCKEEEETPTGFTINDLQGQWVRVDGNNPSADGMIVNVTGNAAVIVAPANTSLSIGDMKWISITQVSGNQFDHQELGSDGNYYEGDITFTSANEIEVRVDASGAGNIQLWEKTESNPDPGEPGEPANTVELDCDISEDLTLTDLGSGVDYIVPCVIDVTAALTIEPGVVIEVEENGGIGVYDNGSFKAIGSSAEPIIIRGTSDVKGWWRGIHIESNSTNNQLDNVIIDGAGSNYVYCCNDIASLYVKDGLISLQNTTIQNGKENGIYIRDDVEVQGYGNVQVTTHDEYPVITSLRNAGHTDGMGSDYSGNGEDYFFILEDGLSEDATIPPVNVPYLIDGVQDVTAGLTILANTEIAMNADAGIGIYDEGFLSIEGQSGEPVIIRGKSNIKGYWRGIHLETNYPANSIEYAVISDAGLNYVYCCNDVATLYFKNGQCAIKNTTLRNGAAYGIYADDNFEFSEYSSLLIETHEELPLLLAPERIGELDGEGSDYTGNNEDYIGIADGAIEYQISWPAANVPYLVDAGDVIDITARVDIAPGTEVYFGENAGLGVYGAGIFNANGTSDKPILFTSYNNFWRGIHIETNSSDNLINYATVENAGSNYVYCCNSAAGIFLKSGQLTVTNSNVINSQSCGIAYGAAANLTESDNTFSDNADGNICD